MTGAPTGPGRELARKSVHVAIGGAALLLRWLTPWQAAFLAVAAVVFNLFVLHRVTRHALLRDGERPGGFSWGIALYPAAILGLVVAFHGRFEIVAGAWALLAFGDGMAAVAGVLLRGPALPWNPQKTWAGFVAFVLYGTATAAFLVRWTQQGVLEAAGGDGAVAPTWIGDSFLAPGVGGRASAAGMLLAACAAAAIASALAESAATRIDDNVLVPAVGGFVLWVATLVEPALLAEASGELAHAVVVGAAVNGALAAAALAVGGATASGAWAGWLLGTALYGFAGWRGLGMLALFFVLGTASTKLGHATKASRGLAQEREGRRGARHAFANATTGVAFAFLAVATEYPGAMLAGLVAAFATAAADTVASEIGQAYGRRHYLVTTLRRVPAGTDGAVSIAGTLAGIAAAVAMGGLAWAVGLVPAAGVAVVVAAAAFGATLESFVGATVQSALRLNNEMLNFANTLAGGIAAAALFAAWS